MRATAHRASNDGIVGIDHLNEVAGQHMHTLNSQNLKKSKENLVSLINNDGLLIFQLSQLRGLEAHLPLLWSGPPRI